MLWIPCAFGLPSFVIKFLLILEVCSPYQPSWLSLCSVGLLLLLFFWRSGSFWQALSSSWTWGRSTAGDVCRYPCPWERRLAPVRLSPAPRQQSPDILLWFSLDCLPRHTGLDYDPGPGRDLSPTKDCLGFVSEDVHRRTSWKWSALSNSALRSDLTLSY